jgi:hypothetical protein
MPATFPDYLILPEEGKRNIIIVTEGGWEPG